MPLLFEQKRSKQQTYIEITGFEGRISFLTIPESIDGIPVRSIGKAAFAGRRDLEEVHLPKGIRMLCRNAFYNCPNLGKLTVYDEIEDYYDGVIRQCGSLSEIEVYLTRGDYSVVKEMLADNDRQLCFVLHLPPEGAQVQEEGGRRTVHLTFPAYVYDFVEDVEARVLHHKIEGAGYPYRECVTRKGIDYRSYDRLFVQVMQEDDSAAIEIAFGRLMYPYDLEKRAEAQYQAYLEKSAGVVLKELISSRETGRVLYLTEHCLIPKAALPEALQQSAEAKAAEVSALLLEYQNRHFPVAAGTDSFELEDW